MTLLTPSSCLDPQPGAVSDFSHKYPHSYGFVALLIRSWGRDSIDFAWPKACTGGFPPVLLRTTGSPSALLPALAIVEGLVDWEDHFTFSRCMSSMMAYVFSYHEMAWRLRWSQSVRGAITLRTQPFAQSDISLLVLHGTPVWIIACIRHVLINK